MPKREDIKTILLIGSGPIIIGQACEFDYSGVQAAKTLKSLGYRVVLINSNPATIMTDPEFADATYIEPIIPGVIEKIIKKEKIDAILPTMGGQTALNVAMEMYEKGMLKGVEFLGANPEAIKKGEDRNIFKQAVKKTGLEMAKSKAVNNMEEAVQAVKEIGFPAILRASFTLGGLGSGIAYNMDEFKELAKTGLEASPISEIEIMESVIGWKEYEMEVIRDREDNCIIVCSIENVDPMGVHTGDSITVAPALTLTDKEYQRLRDASFAILREIGVDTGGSNVQFAINPENGRMIVIEMNPRVSRSSALASKATGYPIAKVATLLAVGYTLDEITNDITGTAASFEPVSDYIITKIPRFTFEKFPSANATLTTSMKSVGEVMAIGRTFKESLQKAICSLETGLSGLDPVECSEEELKRKIRIPNDKRILYIAEAFRKKLSVNEVYDLCKIDRWFLNQIKEIVDFEKFIDQDILKNEELLRYAKSYGFSDKKISFLANVSEEDVYQARKKMGINIDYNEVDTCAAEFDTTTSYLYSTVNITKNVPLRKADFNDKKVLILGGGPNRIGQGIEFDYCCVHAAYALTDLGVKTIMYNCNPETVSTDYDTSDVLYFEPIDFERVRNVIELENPDGVIVQFGGQTPLKLAGDLTKIGAKIIGTSAEVIDEAEDREKFSKFIQKLKLNQPENGTAFTKKEAFKIAKRISYPVLVRPSYVLGGRAMRIVYNEDELREYMDEAVSVSNKSPVLIDKFLDNSIELDVDALSDTKNVYIGGIMQHIEEAGIHSGDSACSLPTVSISREKIKEIENATKEIALNLGVKGLLNIQYALHRNKLFLIEVNPRASRTVPFVSKATGMPLAKIATRIMWNLVYNPDINDGNILEEALNFYNKFNVVTFDGNVYKPHIKKHIALKEAVFPFNKLPGADLILGPEMKSTGEVMGISSSFGESFSKVQQACKNILPTKGRVFISLTDLDKESAPNLAKSLKKLGFDIVATSGTYKVITASGIDVKKVLKVSEGRPNIVDMIKNEEIALVVNTSDNRASKNDAKIIRREVLNNGIPYFTTISAALAAVDAIKFLQNNEISVSSLQNYFKI